MVHLLPEGDTWRALERYLMSDKIPPVSAMVQLPDKTKKKKVAIVCLECGRQLTAKDYILSIDPYSAKGEDGRVKRGNWCEECYEQRRYNVGFKKTKKKNKKRDQQDENLDEDQV